MSRDLKILEELANAEEGIQKTWQNRVAPDRRFARGHAVRRYMKTNMNLVESDDGNYFNPLQKTFNIPLEKCRDLYRFFFEEKLHDEYYFEE